MQLSVPRGEGKHLGIERLNERCFLISSAGNKKGIFFLPLLLIKKRVANVGEDIEKLEISHTAGRKVKWYSHFGK